MEQFLKIFERTVKACWSRPSICNYGGESFTYGELAAEIEKFHTLFDNLGLEKGDKIAICARNSTRWAIAFFASTSGEYVTVPILSDFLPGNAINLTDHSESKVLFIDPDIWNKIDPKDIPTRLLLAVNNVDFSPLYTKDESVAAVLQELDASFKSRYPDGFSEDDVCYPDPDPQQLALINYTSGTTSAPKGVMITYGNLSATMDFCISNQPNSPEDKVVSMLPLAHMYGLGIEFMYPCITGCPMYFLGKTPSPTLLMKAMQDIRPYLVVSVPLVMEKVYKSSIKPIISKWYMRILLNTPIVSSIIYRKIGSKLMGAFGGKVRSFIMGGAALNPEVEKCFRKCRIPFTIGYGMTEASPLISWESVDKFVLGSCGKACHQVRIDSEDPIHIAGEIQVKGPNICIGYFNNPDANAMAFTSDGWLRTGDLGILDKEGNIFIKGRSKSMILTANGQNVYPEELEAVINAQPYVAESLAVDRSGKIVALVVLDKDAIRRDKLDEETVSDIPEKIQAAANRSLPAYSHIAKVEVMASPFEKTPKLSIKRFLYK